MGDRLIVNGATGATGQRICRLAADLGLRPVAVGRRADALEAVARPLGIDHRVADLDDLDAAFSDARVVVNCVGPYARFGPPVLAAAIRARASYVDCTGEPRWVQTIDDHFERDAIAAGVTLLPSLGGGVVTDLAVHAAAGRAGTPKRIMAAIQIVGMRPSAATMRSTVGIIAGGAPIADRGQIVWAPPGSRRHAFTTGAGTLFASPDAILLSKGFPSAVIEGHMQPGAAGPVLATASGLLRRPRARAAVDRWLDRSDGSRTHGAGGGRIRSTAEVDGVDGRAVVVAEADDIYDVTGSGVVAVVRRLLEGVSVTGLQPAGAVLGDPVRAAAEIGVRIVADP